MTDYILEHARPIDKARLTALHRDEDGDALLEIKLYYYRDSSRRGLKLSVRRCLKGGGFTSYDIMNRYNGLVHLADMARKPSPRVAAQWRGRVEAQLDAIATIALASDTPDWPAISALFEGESV